MVVAESWGSSTTMYSLDHHGTYRPQAGSTDDGLLLGGEECANKLKKMILEAAVGAENPRAMGVGGFGRSTPNPSRVEA